jgi:AcrR family transcriptional regulator
MEKINPLLFERILSEIEAGKTTTDALKSVGLARATFYYHLRNKAAHLKQRYKKAQETRRENIAVETTERSISLLLDRLVNGETTTSCTYDDDGKLLTRTTVHKPCSVGLLIFALKKYIPEIFGDDIPENPEPHLASPTIYIVPKSGNKP